MENKVYKPATEEDFDKFVNDFCDSTEGWSSKLSKDTIKVWDKPSDTSLNIVKLWTVYPDIEALVLYDVLHDPDYRKVWDDKMIDGHCIEQIDKTNDVGYYSAKAPFPVASRDFVNQRCWRVKGDEHVIMNFSVIHDKEPEKKDFVRAFSHKTGYLVRKRAEGGCELTYVTHTDPKGSIPTFIINKVTTSFAPDIVARIAKAAKGYEEWKSKNNPEKRPWRD
eukprot:TRINITY_DN12492_c0_g1_i1.p1 TRINITY_DN12492_c0_g1~~TRINITY_DN12492_c0_g1_i1.p1  ORF type:complete len:240 (-),score=60.57 TRINITY_DN12492_c0_g1_i1:83-748(-)